MMLKFKGILELDPIYITTIKKEAYTRNNKFSKEAEAFKEFKRKQHESLSKKELTESPKILLIISTSFSGTWTKKIALNLENTEDSFYKIETEFPSPKDRDKETGDYIIKKDHRIIFSIIMHTISDYNILARRRLGIAFISLKDVLEEDEIYHNNTDYSFKILPMVNESNIHRINLGYISEVSIFKKNIDKENVDLDFSFETEKESKTNSNKHRVYETHIESIMNLEETFWKSELRDNPVRDEISRIRLNYWRTPNGKTPLRFFFWDRNSVDINDSDPEFFENAIEIALSRLGNLDKNEFIEYAEIALGYKEYSNIKQLLEARVRSAEIIATSISSIVTSSPYLTDLARIPEVVGFLNGLRMKKISSVLVEHFARSIDTNSADCEDFTATVIILWSRLCMENWSSNKKVSLIVKLASEIARKYKHIALLASVTSPDIASSVSKHFNKYVSVESEEYLNSEIVGHCFSMSLPNNYFDIITSSSGFSEEEEGRIDIEEIVIKDKDYWPVLTLEGTSVTDVLPLPSSAYRGVISLSELNRFSSIENKDYESIFRKRFKKDSSYLYGGNRKRLGYINDSLEGFVSMMRDDLLDSEQFKNFPDDANASQFYREVVWGYITPECSGRSKNNIAKDLFKNFSDNRDPNELNFSVPRSFVFKNFKTGGSVGINYRYIATQDTRLRIKFSPTINRKALEANYEARFRFITPVAPPLKTKYSGSTIIRSNGFFDKKGGTVRLYRPGFYEESRLDIICNFLDIELNSRKYSMIRGYRVIHDVFGSFVGEGDEKNDNWNKRIDSSFQSIRLEINFNI